MKKKIIEYARSCFSYNPFCHAGEWAEKNFRIPDGGSRGCMYNHKKTPYLTAVFEACNNPEYNEIVFTGAAQLGKSIFVLINLLYDFKVYPQSTMLVFPTENIAEDFIKYRLITGLKDSAKIANIDIELNNSRVNFNNIRIQGEPCRVNFASSASRLCSTAVKNLYLDEVDRIKKNMKNEGDAITLVKARTLSYPNHRIVYTSTPTDLDSVIWELWTAGTGGEWSIQCRACKEYFVPKKEIFRYEDMKGKYIGYLIPPCCSKPMYEADRWASINEGGKYVYKYPDRAGMASFWVSGLCSPNTTLDRIAGDYTSAVLSADQDKIKAIINTSFGEPYDSVLEEIEEKLVINTFRDYDKPDGIDVVYAGVDVQQMEVIVAVRGFRQDNTSFLLDHKRIAGETDKEDVWRNLYTYFHTPINGYKIDYMGIDSRYKPYFVYSFISSLGLGKAVAVRGVARNVEAPVMGRPISPIWRGKEQFDDKSLWTLHVSDIYFKGLLYGLIKTNSKWFINKKAAHDEDYLKQVSSEYEKKIKGKIVWQKKIGRENHFLDCEKMILALYHSTFYDILNARRGGKKK